VTAYNDDDALTLIRERVFGGGVLPAIEERLEDVDVSTLEPGHDLPNMKSPRERGVWFPLGID